MPPTAFLASAPLRLCAPLSASSPLIRRTYVLAPPRSLRQPVCAPTASASTERASDVKEAELVSSTGGDGGGGGEESSSGLSAGAVGRGVLVAGCAAMVCALAQGGWLAGHRDLALVGVFVAGYGAIVLEGFVDVNKAAPALLMGAAVWTTMLSVAAVGGGTGVTEVFGELDHAVLDVAQILLFLAGAMSTVEIMDGHDAFRMVTDRLPRGSKRQLLWAVSFATFFLSSVLDDLTTTIVMLSLLRKIIPDEDTEARMLFGGAVVIAANAGGAWSPIGDVTTTLIWQHGNISVLPTVLSLFVPSITCMMAATALIARQLADGPVVPTSTLESNEAAPTPDEILAAPKPPGSETVFWSGVAALLFVPVFKTVTGVPPYLAMAVSLGGMWALTDLMHADKKGRDHLRAEHLVQKVDINSLIFFMGILLAMGGLQSAGILGQLATFLDSNVPSRDVIAALIGVSSAIVDNVALVAATLGMWTLEQVPMDSATWQQGMSYVFKQYSHVPLKSTNVFSDHILLRHFSVS
jgi:Na+/H+ antiporter NhaD/arsenite permease-like protein